MLRRKFRWKPWYGYLQLKKYAFGKRKSQFSHLQCHLRTRCCHQPQSVPPSKKFQGNSKRWRWLYQSCYFQYLWNQSQPNWSMQNLYVWESQSWIIILLGWVCRMGRWRRWCSSFTFYRHHCWDYLLFVDYFLGVCLFIQKSYYQLVQWIKQTSW